MERTIGSWPCTFRRTQDSKMEFGIAVGQGMGDIDVIVCTDGKVVDDVWDYKCSMPEPTYVSSK